MIVSLVSKGDLQFVPDFHLFNAVKIDAQHECIIDHLASAPGTQPGLTFYVTLFADFRAAERGNGVLKIVAFRVDRGLLCFLSL